MKVTNPNKRISYLRLRDCRRAAFCLSRSSKMSRSRKVAASAEGWKGSMGSLRSLVEREELRAC